MHTTDGALSSRSRLAAVSLAVVVVSGVFFFSFHDYGLAQFDEGVLMEGVRLQLEGRMDHARFTHYSVQFPLLAWVSPESGPDLERVRMVWVVVRAATAGLIFLIGAYLLPLRWALLPAAFYLALPGPWHKAPVAFGLCLCLFAMLRAMKHGRRRDSIWLAMSLVAAFSLHPYTGTLSALAWGMLVIVLPCARYAGVSGPRSLSRAAVWNGLVALIAVAGTLVVTVFSWRVSPLDLLGQNAGLARSIAPGSHVFAAQLRHFAADPTVAMTLSLYLVIAPVLAYPLWLAWKHREPASDPYIRAALMCVAVVGGFNLAKWIVRFDLAHLLQNAAPMWILLALTMRQLTVRAVAGRGPHPGGVRTRALASLVWLWAAAVLVFGLTSPDTFVGGVGTRIATDTVPLNHPSGTLHVRPEVGRSLAELDTLVRAHSNEGDTLLISALPKILHYLSQRPSPTVAPAFAFPAIFATNPVDEIIDSIRTAETPIVVFNPDPIIPIEAYRLDTLAPELYRLINDDYRLIAEVGNLQVRVMRLPVDFPSRTIAPPLHSTENQKR